MTRLDREQARRIARLLDGAAQTRIEAWLEEGTQSSLGGADYYESFQALLRRTIGSPREMLSRSREPAART